MKEKAWLRLLWGEEEAECYLVRLLKEKKIREKKRSTLVLCSAVNNDKGKIHRILKKKIVK